MARQMATPRLSTGSGTQTTTSPALPPLPRQRSTRVMALGIALVCVGMLASWFIINGLNKQVPVVVATRDVPLGTVLSAADLGTALVSAEATVTTIPGAQLQELVGTVAATDLRGGSLLVPSQVTQELKPGPGQNLVAVALKPTQLPARGLRSGDQVLVVATPGQGGQGGQSTTKPVLTNPVAAVVDKVGAAGDHDASTVVDLIVTADVAAKVSQQASTGRIALVLQPRSS